VATNSSCFGRGFTGDSPSRLYSAFLNLVKKRLEFQLRPMRRYYSPIPSKRSSLNGLSIRSREHTKLHWNGRIRRRPYKDGTRGLVIDRDVIFTPSPSDSGHSSTNGTQPFQFVRGDCGSWVIDANTFEVYGHIVASDGFGDSYVVPIVDVFRDISAVESADRVEFPSEETVLSNIQLYQ